jgi:hypothetical protein
MGRSARILDVQSLAEFRAHLAQFGIDVRDTLCAVDMHIHRMFDWLEERGKYWHKEIRVREEEVVRAKIELNSRKNMKKDGYGPGTTDQEKALRKAQARLKEAQDKLQSCKRWKPLLDHAIREYQGPARQLGTALDTELVNSLAILLQKLTALEAYLSMAPPSVGLPAGEGTQAPAEVASTAPHEPEALAAEQDKQRPAALATATNENEPHEHNQQHQ